MNRRMDRSMGDNWWTVVQHFPKPATVELAEDSIDSAMWVVTLRGRRIGNRFINNIEPVVPDAPTDAEQRNRAVFTPGYDVDSGPLAASGKYLTWKFRMRVNLFFVSDARVAKPLESVCSERSVRVSNWVVWLQPTNVGLLKVRPDIRA